MGEDGGRNKKDDREGEKRVERGEKREGKRMVDGECKGMKRERKLKRLEKGEKRGAGV